MSSRILGSLALLIGAVAIERFMYYGYRSFLPITLMDRMQLTSSKMGMVFALMTIVTIVASLVAGGLAFLVQPRLIATGGALVASLGLVVFAMASSEGAAITGLLLGALGSGLVRPCAYGYAARVLTFEGETELAPASGRRFLSMACFMALLLAAINVAAFLAPPIFGVLMQRVGFRVPTLLCVALSVLASAAFGVSVLVDPERRAPSSTPAAQTAYRTEPGTEGAQPGSNPVAIVGALTLALPGALAYLVESAVNRPQDGDYRQFGFLQSAQGAGSVLASLVVFVVLLVLAQNRSRLSVAMLVGVGYVVFAAGATSMLLSPFVMRLFGMTVMGLAEPLYGLAAVFGALAARGKARTLVVAGFMFILSCGSLLSGPIAAAEGLSTVVTVGGALLLLVTGIVLAALSSRIRTFFEAA